jgi:hypothetical protein
MANVRIQSQRAGTGHLVFQLVPVRRDGKDWLIHLLREQESPDKSGFKSGCPGFEMERGTAQSRRMRRERREDSITKDAKDTK